jgi:hypothetical protein
MLSGRIKSIVPLTFLLFCSCAWWGAQTTIEMSDTPYSEASLAERIASELRAKGYSIQDHRPHSHIVKTEWYGRYAQKKRKYVPYGSSRYMLRFRIMPQHRQIRVAVRHQQLVSAGSSVSRGGTNRSGWRIVRDTYEMYYDDGQLHGGTLTYAYSSGGGGSVGGGNSSIVASQWEGAPPESILWEIDGMLSDIIPRMGQGLDYCWILVDRPYRSGPRYVGTFPRQKKE